jgi:PAS domain S-box-containing protein
LALRLVTMQEKNHDTSSPDTASGSLKGNNTGPYNGYSKYLAVFTLLLLVVGYLLGWFSTQPADILLVTGVLFASATAYYLIKIKPKEAEATNGVTEKKFELLLESAPDATVVVNESGNIQMVNRQTENLFGYHRDELIGKQIEILIPPEVRGRHLHHRSGFQAAPKVRSMGVGNELKAIKKDGSSFPVEISLSPIQTEEGLLVSASVRDITDRKKAEERFRSLLNSAPDATVIVNDKGRIEMINQQVENLFGYERNELVGQPVEIMIPGNLKDMHVQHRSGYVKAPKVRTMGAGIELKAVKKDGTLFPVEISLSPIQTEEGIWVSASIRDISERKKLEDDLRKSHGDIEAFTYSVSHDLRAPLRAILGYTNILEEDYASKLDEEAKKITAIIKRSTLRMGQLIDDLLAFSHMEKKEILKTAVDMGAIVTGSIVDIMEHDNGNDSITWDVRPLPGAQADRNLITQVWVNILSNAVKYTRNKESPRIKVGSKEGSKEIIFYVKDNGAGFDEQYKHKLFKVFQRLHDADEFEGTGVGLALVERIISKHGGRVWAEGKENEGACFYFSLPVNQKAT